MGSTGESWHVLHWSDGSWLSAACHWPGFAGAELGSLTVTFRGTGVLSSIVVQL